MKNIFFIIFCINSLCASGQQALIANIDSRNTINLNGKWQYIVDPYGTGFYDYRYKEKILAIKMRIGIMTFRIIKLTEGNTAIQIPAP